MGTRKGAPISASFDGSNPTSGLLVLLQCAVPKGKLERRYAPPDVEYVMFTVVYDVTERSTEGELERPKRNCAAPWLLLYLAATGKRQHRTNAGLNVLNKHRD
ncbi:MAG TPA: hypothetical protein VMF65_14510 [Acidimicrobiales bacterium]|nr:hypothetical protein [Acidimicrobiales bacterium]